MLVYNTNRYIFIAIREAELVELNVIFVEISITLVG